MDSRLVHALSRYSQGLDLLQGFIPQVQLFAEQLEAGHHECDKHFSNAVERMLWSLAHTGTLLSDALKEECTIAEKRMYNDLVATIARHTESPANDGESKVNAG